MAFPSLLPRSLSVLLLVAAGAIAAAQDTRYAPEGELIPGPNCAGRAWPAPPRACTPEQYDLWLADVTHWRAEHRIRMGYNASAYERPELKWTQSSFIQPQVMMEDRYLYDPERGTYTVDRFLDDLDRRYGGVDAVLLWHTYPNIGIDDRNQYDLLADLPGGLAGVRAMVEQFHKRGVRVLFPVMLWDQGTHDPGTANWDASARAMKEVGADGLNGDTLDGFPRAFVEASDAAGHPLALEPEGGVGDDQLLAWNTMSWGYWKYDTEPKISRYKWLETRHMVNVCDRWAKSKTDNLQYAFFNGVGYESWENIWGIWNQIAPRDAEALRRVAAIERAFADLLTSQQWRPFYPTLQYGLYASAWPGEGETLYTLVNRNAYDVQGAQMQLSQEEGARYFDLWNGRELTPQSLGGNVQLSFPVEASGFGAVLVTHRALDAAEGKLLAREAEWAKSSLASFSNTWKPMHQEQTPIAKTRAAKSAPEGMVLIPAADYEFVVQGMPIEGGNDVGVDVQYPWEDEARRYHRHTMHIDAFYFDRAPVTNAQFKQFLNATHYRPKDDHNFLKHWTGGSFAPEMADEPVVYVSLEDARAYAAWAGKRLPHEWEWQYAGQGLSRSAYPWGNTFNAAMVAAVDKTRGLTHPESVGLHPQAASPFGVLDMVGNVWQWTDEYRDEHTRAAVLRGGSYYQPQGSIWYFPSTYRLDEHGKYLLLSPGRDRAGTIGFRCAVDAEGTGNREQ
ncbi:formylglycine-generating enzyme family protein [Acidobacteria bacterium AB60]|nr:formylglycine-generating enzyme family protein [Acidobacteria bacterium AB60]